MRKEENARIKRRIAYQGISPRITVKQAAILDMMVQYFKEEYRMPMLKEVCLCLGYASDHGAARQINTLITRGWLGRFDKKPRGYFFTDMAIENYGLYFGKRDENETKA